MSEQEKRDNSNEARNIAIAVGAGALVGASSGHVITKAYDTENRSEKQFCNSTFKVDHESFNPKSDNDD